MYCTKCRKDVGSIEFCEICGAATIENIAQEQAAASIVIPKDNVITIDAIKTSVKSISIKKIIIFALVAVFAVIMFIGYKSLDSFTSPKATAERYINALVAGEYDKAFDMLEGTDDNYLTKDYFLKYMELLNVKDKHIVSLNQDLNDQEQLIYNILGIPNQPDQAQEDDVQYFTTQIGTEFLNLVIVKSGTVFGVIDEWKIDTETFIQSWDITVPKGTEVFVDGNPVMNLKSTQTTDKNMVFGTPAKETLTFQIEKMFPGEYEITATLEGAKDIKIMTTTEQPQSLVFEPTDKLVSDLRKVGDSLLKLYYSNAEKSSFDGLINPDSQFLQNIDDPWYDSRSDYQNVKINDIETTTQSIQDADHAQLTFAINFYYDYEDWSWFETKIETRQEEQEYTMSFVRTNGNWLIDEVYKKGF